ncbi:MAG: rhomboid family intramembrane serine protease [Treponema sp.]|jgi:membrane associated rhomboid family serine protease|nr:rhomboid family intramembrane serine protease [Treponema sp.]
MNLIRKPFRYRNSNLVLYLIGINILVFILQQISPAISYYAALNPVAVIHGQVWQFVTYMFAHGSINHLLFNMLGLFIFGTQVERYIGSSEFLLYYMLVGVLAGFFSFFVYLFTGNNWVFLLGASGALFAVQLAYATFFPDSIIYIFGILPLRAPFMVLGFTLITVVSLVIGINNGVAHLTHLAGFGFGWLYFLIRFGKNPWRSLIG